MGSSPANQFFRSTYIKILKQARQTVGGKDFINEYKGYLRELLVKNGSWVISALKHESEKENVFFGKMENICEVHNAPYSLV